MTEELKLRELLLEDNTELQKGNEKDLCLPTAHNLPPLRLLVREFFTDLLGFHLIIVL